MLSRAHNMIKHVCVLSCYGLQVAATRGAPYSSRVAPEVHQRAFLTGAIMSAYVVVQVEVTDPAGYNEYKNMVPPSLAAYDGKFVVRGGACETLEGSWQPKRLVVLEFPSVAKARAWWASDE